MTDQDNKRIDALINIGLIFNGDSFVYKDVNVHWTELSMMEDEEFYFLVEKLRKVILQRKGLPIEEVSETKEKVLAWTWVKELLFFNFILSLIAIFIIRIVSNKISVIDLIGLISAIIALGLTIKSLLYLRNKLKEDENV
jgi:hypothetical protein